METFGTGALSLDNKGDDGEEDLGVSKDEDNNDDEEPGQVCMYACVLFITRWQWQSAGSSPTNAGAIISATNAGMYFHCRLQRDLKSGEEGAD